MFRNQCPYKRRFQGEVTIAGCVDTVRRHTLERLEIFAPGGGFIFQQVHNILAGVPPENIVAMFEAVKEFNG